MRISFLPCPLMRVLARSVFACGVLAGATVAAQSLTPSTPPAQPSQPLPQSAQPTQQPGSAAQAPAADYETAPYINFDYADLARVREGIRHNARGSRAAYASLMRQANGFLDVTPETVMDKRYTPPSGDKHDFFSIGFYSWPNPDTPDGIPYIRRDGHRNPEALGPEYDKQRYTQMRVRANTLALAWFFTGDEKYAAKAAEVLRVWFLDPETRMNPNFNFSSSLPGVYDGMAIGIIEGAELIRLIDSLRLLEASESWTAEDRAGMKQWFADYTDWLLNSKLGREEGRAKNNHVTWYAAQIAACALYTGDTELVRRMAEQGRQYVDLQIAADGSLPREMSRNRSRNYAIYGLRAFAALARAASAVNEDLWHYKTPDGRGLELSFAFIAPYIAGQEVWPRPDLDTSFNFLTLEMIRLAAKEYRTPELTSAIRQLESTATPADRFTWLNGVPLDTTADAPAAGQ